MTPGKITINEMWGLTALAISHVGNEIYPLQVTINTQINAVVVPKIQLSVEYLSADHPAKESPPIVYTTQPMTAINKIAEGIKAFVAVKKVEKSPFVMTSIAPINAKITHPNVNICGLFLKSIQTITIDNIGISDSIIEAAIVPGSPSKS